MIRQTDSKDPTERLTTDFFQRREVLLLFFLAILVFSVYSNTLGSPFVFDDKDNIENNPYIRITRLDGVSLKSASRSIIANRPVTNLSFALNYYFHGYRVIGYHLVNILIHMTNGILLYLLVKNTLNLAVPKIPPLCRSEPEKKQKQVSGNAYRPAGDQTAAAGFYLHPARISFFTALIWLVHPIQTQSVTYIVQRMNGMATLFYVLALLLYVRARVAQNSRCRIILYSCCVLSGFLALGSKEISVTLPLFIILYEWYFFQDLSLSWLKRSLLPFAGVLIFLVLVVFWYTGTHPLQRILSGYGGREFTLSQRLLTEFRVVIFYIGLLMFPHPSRLNLDHDFPLSLSLFHPLSTFFSIAGVIGLLGLALYLARRDRLISFCILWFLGNLVVESSIIALEIIFEHRTYLPSMMLALMVVLWVHRYIKPGWLGVGILCFAVALGTFWTYNRNKVWQDDISLRRDTVAKSPRKARPHYGLGVALAAQGHLDEAIVYFNSALNIDPNHVAARNSLGSALARQGRVKEATDQYHKVLAINPAYAGAYYNLGKVQTRLGNIEGAVSSYRKALAIDPVMPQALYNLGWILATSENEKYRNGREAVSLAESLLKISGDRQPLVLDALAAAYAEAGRFTAAVSTAKQALALAEVYGMGEPAAGLKERLMLYQNGRPYRQPTD